MTDVSQTTYFVTGFPGFIGRRLVPALLQRDVGARLFLLVQPRLEERARAELAKLGPDAASRVTLFTGDVVDMHLGLASGEYRQITAEITDVFHLAALYSHGSDATALNQVNVDGTRNVLELATDAPSLRRFHHMSTTTVAGDREGVIAEDELDEGQRFHTAYEESKFLSERLVQRMRSQIPISVYRPGIVVGDSRTGEIDRFDGPYYLAIMLVMSPSGVPLPIPGNLVAPLNVVPIDFVIEAVLQIAHDPRAVGRTFHIVDPNPMAARRVYEWIAAHTGKKLPSIRIDHRIADRLLKMPFLERLAREERAAIASVNHLAMYNSANTLEMLDGSGIRCPRLNTYLDRLIDYVMEHYKEKRSRAAPEPEVEDALR
jgi:thioester reductase-like protein